MYFDTRVPQNMAGLDQDLFFVSADFVGSSEMAAAPAAGATQALVLTVDQDAHLLLCGAAFVCTDTAETTDVPTPFILITLKLSSSGRELMASAQHLRNVAGTGSLPCAWPRPKFIAAGSSMRVTAQNLAGAIRRLRLTFYSFKIFLKDATPATR